MSILEHKPSLRDSGCFKTPSLAYSEFEKFVDFLKFFGFATPNFCVDFHISQNRDE
jgi:hypothetical protein